MIMILIVYSQIFFSRSRPIRISLKYLFLFHAHKQILGEQTGIVTRAPMLKQNAKRDIADLPLSVPGEPGMVLFTARCLRGPRFPADVNIPHIPNNTRGPLQINNSTS